MSATIAQEDVIKKIDGFVADQLPLLKPVEDSWQPADFLPDMASGDWEARLRELRQGAEALSDDVLVVLTGNLVTEEALPSYQTWLNRSDGISDETGASDSAWGQWTRGWTAEEKRHGDLLSKYLYLSGRVNMRSVEITTQHLIRNGFDLKSENDIYKSLFYASFQERATKISHVNTGKLAERCGDRALGRICATIGGDEARHEEAYKRIFGKIVEADPEGAVLAAEQMIKQKIVMPARLMSDGTDADLFVQFAIVAQRVGVYTARDYADILDHLVEYWKLPGLFLSGKAAAAQEYVCSLAKRYRDKADRIQETVAGLPQEPFEWIFGRKA